MDLNQEVFATTFLCSYITTRLLPAWLAAAGREWSGADPFSLRHVVS